MARRTPSRVCKPLHLETEGTSPRSSEDICRHCGLRIPHRAQSHSLILLSMQAKLVYLSSQTRMQTQSLTNPRREGHKCIERLVSVKIINFSARLTSQTLSGHVWYEGAEKDTLAYCYQKIWTFKVQ